MHVLFAKFSKLSQTCLFFFSNLAVQLAYELSQNFTPNLFMFF